MANKQANELANAITAELMKYPPQVYQKVSQAIENVTEVAVTELKATSPTRPRGGAYRANWKKRTINESRLGKKNVIYNAKHYRLTHLLEKGHLTRNGGRTKAIPHIAPVEQKITEMLPKEIERLVE